MEISRSLLVNGERVIYPWFWHPSLSTLVTIASRLPTSCWLDDIMTQTQQQKDNLR